MIDWKIAPRFETKGVKSLAEKDLRVVLEPGDGKRPGFLTIDIYPEIKPKRPKRHYGTWQFAFDQIGNEFALTVDTEGVRVSSGGKALSPVKTIEGGLREDGLYIIYLVLAEEGTYRALAQTQYYHHLSFSGATLDPVKHWPESRQRTPSIIAPEYWMMTRLYEAVENFAAALPADCSVLDYGGGVAPYYPCFASHGIRHTNADIIDGPFVDVVCKPGEALSFKSEAFDAVICTHVIEHTLNPREIISELHRVLKKGGKILVGVPFAWEHHHQPTDFWRFGRNILDNFFSPFRDVKIDTDSNASQALIMLKNCHYFRSVKNNLLRNTLIRWGNFRYKLAARCGDQSLTCNYIITGAKP